MPEGSQTTSVPLNVSGSLDTMGPITNRPPGTLVRAWDTHHQYLGPRRGSKAFTRVWENPGTASLYNLITLTQTGALDTSGFFRSSEDQFVNIGTQFTLDIWFRLDETTYAGSATEIGLYVFSSNIRLFLNGPGHASPRLVKATITTTPTTASTDTPVTLTGTSQVAVGTDQDDRTHVRLVRDGANAYLFVNGVQEATSSSLVATSPTKIATPGTAILGIVGYSGNGEPPLDGQVYGCVLRDGAYRSYPIEATMPRDPWARNVHHYFVGRTMKLGGSYDHYLDLGRFGVHARIVGANYTVTAANNNAAPAPAPVQGMATWTTRGGRTATAVIAGGVLSHAIIS